LANVDAGRIVIRTLVPEWSWKTLGAPFPEPLWPEHEGHWQGAIRVGGKDIPVDLTIGDKESVFQIKGHPAQPTIALGLTDGLVVGKTRGDLGIFATKLGQSDLTLRLFRQSSNLAGETDVMRPIPHAGTRSTTPCWIQLSH